MACACTVPNLVISNGSALSRSHSMNVAREVPRGKCMSLKDPRDPKAPLRRVERAEKENQVEEKADMAAFAS